MNVFEVAVMVSIFIILLVVIFHTVRSAFDLGEIGSFFVSVCVSALCIIGIRHFLKGSIEVILLPYTAMAIAILLISLFSFISKHSKGAKDRLSDYIIRKDDAAQTDNKKLRRLR